MDTPEGKIFIRVVLGSLFIRVALALTFVFTFVFIFKQATRRSRVDDWRRSMYGHSTCTFISLGDEFQFVSATKGRILSVCLSHGRLCPSSCSAYPCEI